MQAREAVSARTAAGDLESARAQLEIAKQECSKASDYAIDRLERAIEREERHLQRNARLLNPSDESALTPFMQWVRAEREEKDRAKGEHTCAPPASPDYGFCTSKIARPDGAPFEVRYWKAAPDEAFNFKWTVEHPLTCVDTGAHRVVDRWSADGEDIVVCELTDHDMRGLKALLRKSGDGTTIEVFSSGYLRRDDSFARKLEHLLVP